MSAAKDGGAVLLNGVWCTVKGCKLVKAERPSDEKIEQAFTACRSIQFAADNAVRHGGEWNLNDLLAAARLAADALNTKKKKKGKQ